MTGGGMMDGMGFGGGYGMYFGMFFWILILIGIVLLVIWAVQKSTGAGGGKAEESAMEVLKKRYARGEIDKEEYNEKKNIIS